MRRLVTVLAFLLLSLPAETQASWSLVSSSGSTTAGNATTQAVTLTSIQAGDLIVLYFGDDTSTTISVSDGTSSLTTTSLAGFAGQFGAFAYLLSSVATGSVTYTVTYGASVGDRTIVGFAFRPLSGATVSKDGTEQFESVATGTSVTTPNITTTGTDGVAVGAVAQDNVATPSAQQINATNADGTQTGGIIGSGWYKTYTSGFTGNATATLSASAKHIGALIAFSQVGGGGSSSRLILLGVGP
jgi:hypothetical protein